MENTDRRYCYIKDINGTGLYEGDVIHIEPNGTEWTLDWGNFLNI